MEAADTQHSLVVTSRHPLLVKRVAHVLLSVKIWPKGGGDPVALIKEMDI